MDHDHIKYNIPSIFVILGATGDLSVKKVIPSLWQLFLHNLLPENLQIIGFSRSEYSIEEFKSFVRNSITSHAKGDIDNIALDKFINYFTYLRGDFNNEEVFKSLRQIIDSTESAWGVCTNKLFYLAVQSAAYKDIFENLAKVELNLPCGGELGWSRILIEKPFGKDLESAKNLQALLLTYFKEEQIYRIDHYLFKELIQGIENFRFSNNLFEKTWDNSTIAKIDISLLESIGVESRGNFYDSVGTLRDVGQNHLLSMLSVITMEYPNIDNPISIQNERAKIIDTLLPWTEVTLKENTLRAQYENYRSIKGVNPDSKVETYFALQTELLHPKWQGIPIFLEAGKRMGSAKKEIVITLKHPENCLLCSEENHNANKIIFELDDKDKISIRFYSKKPGFDNTIEERELTFFVYEKEVEAPYVEEYAKVFHDAIGGLQSRFSSAEEIENSWKFIDPIINYWAKEEAPLYEYTPDTIPTQQLPILDKKDIDLNVCINNEIGIIGLGKMGGGLARKLISRRWRVVGYNRDQSFTNELVEEGLVGVASIVDVAQKLNGPKTIWLMVPHTSVDSVISELIPHLSSGDTIIDGGNSPFKESIRREKELKDKGINFLDAGVSGGPCGARTGACIMVGGDESVYNKNEELFKELSISGGLLYVGGAGAGHFVKMVHNGIEYGMMQSLGEGFEILKKSSYGLDVGDIAELYNHGSVITSKLTGWLASAYKKYGNDLNNGGGISGVVSASGEGQWTVDIAHEMNIPAKIIEDALNFRNESVNNPTYTGQVVSALRHEFGGHDASNKKS